MFRFGSTFALLLVQCSVVVLVVTSAGADQANDAALIARVGEYVARYYGRAQTLVATETVVVQPVTGRLKPDGPARQIVNEMRIEWEPLVGSQPRALRELRNAIEHAVILCTTDELRPEDLPKPLNARAAAPPRAAAPRPTLRELREQWLAPLERRYFVELLGECDGNVRAAASRAGVDPVTMYRLLRRRGVTVRRKPE